MATEITLPLAYQDSLNVKEAVTQAAVAPVTAQERIESVDALRGVALHGILLMNIIGFGLPMTELAMEIKPHRAGYWELFKWRMEKVVGFQSIMFYRFGFYDVAGMMLIGMALFKLGIITAERGRKFYLWMILFGFGLGGTFNALISIS